MCSVGKEAKVSVVSHHHPARAEWSTVCVAWTTGGRACDGQPSSPFKKKKEEGTCNSSLIKIIFRPIIYWKNERGGKSGLFFLLSYVTAPICPPFGPPQKRVQGVEIRKNGGHSTVL
jgi:hypothetical protein